VEAFAGLNVFHRMQPHGMKWTCEPYKMHLYGPGGKFQRHVDTLHAENHVATVVVGRPSSVPHEGGNLVVDFRGETRTLAFAARDPSPDAVQAVCFFTLPRSEGGHGRLARRSPV